MHEKIQKKKPTTKEESTHSNLTDGDDDGACRNAAVGVGADQNSHFES